MKALVLSGGTYTDPSTRKVFDRVAAQGIEITLAMPRKVKHAHFPGPVRATPWDTPGVRLELLETWYSHPNPTHMVLKGLPRLIRDLEPDIIHCVMEPWAFTCLQVARRLPRGSAAGPRFGVQACETKLSQGSALATYVRRSLYRRVLSRCDFFVAWSSLTLEVARRLDLDGKQQATFPAVGIDLDLFHPPEDGEKTDLRREQGVSKPDEFLVGYVGRFVEEKGLLDLLAAMDRAVGEARDLRLALMGNGPLFERLRSAAETRSWLRVLEPAGQVAVARFMRTLDVLALPSRTTPSWEEQFGLVLPEAMATGVPIVGSACGAIPEVVADAGWIVPEGNIGALADRILDISRSRADVVSKGKIARARARDLYSDEAVSRQLTQVWRGALGGEAP